MKVIKNVFLVYDRCKSVHHGFMKAIKMCISFLRVFQKLSSRFMRVSTVCSSFDERLKNLHQDFMKVSTICTSILWAPSKFAAGRQRRPAARANSSVECTKVHRAWDCRRILHGGEKSLRRSARNYFFSRKWLKTKFNFNFVLLPHPHTYPSTEDIYARPTFNFVTSGERGPKSEIILGL